MTLSRAGSTGHRHYLPTCRETSLWKHWWREFSLHKKHVRCVCVCVCLSLCELAHTLSLLCASVSLCICVRRGHVYKRSSTRCHTQTYKFTSDRNNSDLPSLSGSESACHRASSSHPSSLNPYFTLICLFFATAKSFIRRCSSCNLNINVLYKAACKASWEGLHWSFRQSDEEGEAEE